MFCDRRTPHTGIEISDSYKEPVGSLLRFDVRTHGRGARTQLIAEWDTWFCRRNPAKSDAYWRPKVSPIAIYHRRAKSQSAAVAMPVSRSAATGLQKHRPPSTRSSPKRGRSSPKRDGGEDEGICFLPSHKWNLMDCIYVTEWHFFFYSVALVTSSHGHWAVMDGRRI